jgi:hypothetical protein
MRRIGSAHSSAQVFSEVVSSITRGWKLETTLITLIVCEYTTGEHQTLSKGTMLRRTLGSDVLSNMRDGALTTAWTNFGVGLNNARHLTVCGICPINNLFGCELALTIRGSTFTVCRVLVRQVSTAYFRSYVTLNVPLTGEEVSTKPTGKVDIIGKVSKTIFQTSPVCCGGVALRSWMIRSLLMA